jgi:hypothetical protein
MRRLNSMVLHTSVVMIEPMQTTAMGRRLEHSSGCCIACKDD